jgi:pyruvate,water dikinase
MTTEASMVLWIDEAGGARTELLGGKLGSLAEMTEAGFEVPMAFGITTDAFRLFADHNSLGTVVEETRHGLNTDDLLAVQRASARLARMIDEAEMPPRLEDDIRSAYARLEERSGKPEVPVAVRSSGVSEDLEGASFAGQYDTYLWIRGADAMLHHVQRCWAGVVGPSVLTYRPTESVQAAFGGPLPGMCVGVQQMVLSWAAGVMFTLDPVNGDSSKIVIEACWGLGEGVVKGDVTPDRFRVDKVTLEVLEKDVKVQTEEYRFDDARGEVALLPIEGERGAECCLADAEVAALAELGKRIERHRGAPQDLEWAVDRDGRLYLLQARPETVWSSRPARTVSAGDEGGAVDRVLDRFMNPGGGKT